MSPLVAPVFLLLIVGAVVFVLGLLLRRQEMMLIGSPAAGLMLIWLILASQAPDEDEEFDRLFGAGNRHLASELRTIKPTFMDGHFISFQMSPSDFDSCIRPQFYEVSLGSPSNILLGESLPSGWPPEIESIRLVLRKGVRNNANNEVYLIYDPIEGRAYASVEYDRW